MRISIWYVFGFGDLIYFFIKILCFSVIVVFVVENNGF